MAQHLILRLEAPLMSFGGDMVDAFGVVRDFPARSMIAGLIGNALGYDRADAAALDRLQGRLVMGSARLREGQRVRDFQTAQLGANDRGWTTRGEPEGRAGGAGTYQSPHIRYRDADADALVLVALRLDPAEEEPSLDAVANALDRPERPLFLGRKPFLPSAPLVAGEVEAGSVLDALQAALALFSPATGAESRSPRAQWPVGEGVAQHAVQDELTDERNWTSGVHAGLRRVLLGRIVGDPA
jgi:CRISPR system Cascade subunit CasD